MNPHPRRPKAMIHVGIVAKTIVALLSTAVLFLPSLLGLYLFHLVSGETCVRIRIQWTNDQTIRIPQPIAQEIDPHVSVYIQEVNRESKWIRDSMEVGGMYYYNT